MYVIRHVDEIPDALKGAVVAIGNFDGVHPGHRALLALAKTQANKFTKPLMVITFEPHPRRVFRPDLPHLNLLSFKEKINILQTCGVDAVYAVHFTRRFSEMSAEAFVETILQQQIGASYVVTGADFVFGHARGGNAAMLEACAARGMFGYTAFTPLLQDGQKHSSTRIRNALSEGKPGLASELLGRPYAISGRVIHGDKRGRTLGFPTANIHLGKRFLPAFGVYAVRAGIDNQSSGERTVGSPDHRIIAYNGVANLGIRPMYETRTPLLEVHLFDYQGDLYGLTLHVSLVEYLRPEKKLPDEQALIEQMREDLGRARTILHEHTVSI